MNTFIQKNITSVFSSIFKICLRYNLPVEDQESTLKVNFLFKVFVAIYLSENMNLRFRHFLIQFFWLENSILVRDLPVGDMECAISKKKNKSTSL